MKKVIVTDEEWDVIRSIGRREAMRREKLILEIIQRSWDAGWEAAEAQYKDYLRTVPGAKA